MAKGKYKDTLACFRVSDLLHPHRDAVQKTCAECGEPIWVMSKNLMLKIPFVCHECAARLIAENPEELGEILPASEAHKRGK